MAKVQRGGSSSQVNDPNGLSLPHLIAAVITAVIGGGVFTMAGDMAAAGANTGAVLIGRDCNAASAFFSLHDVLLRTEQIQI